MFHSLTVNCFYLFFKCFTKRTKCTLSLFYYFTLIRLLYSSPVEYSYLSILPGDNADIVAASLLIWYFSFLYLILSSIVMINFHIPSKRFFLKCKKLSDVKGVSTTKRNMVLKCNFFSRLTKS